MTRIAWQRAQAARGARPESRGVRRAQESGAGELRAVRSGAEGGVAAQEQEEAELEEELSLEPKDLKSFIKGA